MELPNEAVGILTRPDVLAYLATTMPDGSPHVAPMWSDADASRGLVLLNTADGRVKVRNIRRDPRVAVAAHVPEALWPPLAIRGTVVRVTTDGADDHIDALARRYTGHPWEPTPGQVRLILEISPSQVRLD
jgi:PPOX class probable F420-dependent enzyme